MADPAPKETRLLYIKYGAVNASNDFVTTGGDLSNKINLVKYDKKLNPVFDANDVCYGSEVTIDCECNFEAASAAETKSIMSKIIELANLTSGRLEICSYNGAKEILASVECIKPPRMSLQHTGGTATYREIKLSFTAILRHSANLTGVHHSYSASFTVNAEGLLTRQITGEIITSSGISASSKLGELLPAKQTGYNRTNYNYKVDTADQKLEYSASDTQLVVAYPAKTNPANQYDAIVDGEKKVATTYNDFGKIQRYNYNYVGAYALDYVTAEHARLLAAGGLVRAAIETSVHKSMQVTAQFEVVVGDANSIVDFSETLKYSHSKPKLGEINYPGHAPQIFKAAPSTYVIEQSGKAAAVGKFPQAADYLFAADNLMSEDFGYQRRSKDVCEISWSYKFLFSAAPTKIAPTKTITKTTTLT